MCISLEIQEDVNSHQPPEAQAIIRVLMAQVAELKSQGIVLQAEVTALRLELGKHTRTPQYSSPPPTTQRPHARPTSTQGESKRKREGQPGHRRHERTQIPVEEYQ